MTVCVRLSTFDEWLVSAFGRRECIRVAGGFRRPSASTDPSLPIMELDGRLSDTVRITLPEWPPVQPIPSTDGFVDRGREWWSTWAAVLAASALVSPVVDPVCLRDILYEKRRVRLCCDTSALCSGIATWMLVLLDGRADIYTSAVVDRELAAWPDGNRGFYAAKTMKSWMLRTKYRLARRLTETTPDGVVTDRLSPEQGALMLAKLRDETARKSPDADMLLVELARGLIRDQPRNARVVYLTGDRNHARAAMNALGHENVLYAAADGRRAVGARGAAVPRGWWTPGGGPLGALFVPPLSHLLWNLLAACDFLTLDAGGGKWCIRQVCTVSNGVPSDWADPWLQAEELAVSTSGTPVAVPTASSSPVSPVDPSSSPGDEDGIGSPLPTGTERPLGSQDLCPTADSTVAEVQLACPPSDKPADLSRDRCAASRDTSPVSDQVTAEDLEWLLPPVAVGPPVEAPSSWRPTPVVFFHSLWRALAGAAAPEPVRVAADAQAEVDQILVALGAVAADGCLGPRIDEFRAAWGRDDLDWFHAELQRLPGYRATLARLREDGSAALPSRQKVSVGMARALGQVARLNRSESALVVGEAPVRMADMVTALERWLPSAGDTLATDELCRLAAQELLLTPARTEMAILRLWEKRPGVPFEGRTGGTVTAGFAENVVAMGDFGHCFRPVAPGALTFGRSGPVRFIVRM